MPSETPERARKPRKQRQAQQQQFIRRLPHYYPQTFHEANIKLGQVSYVSKVSNFLEVPPLFLCIVFATIFVVLVFAKFLVNFIITMTLFLSSLYNCFYMTAAADQFIFSQILNLTVSLTGLALYLLVNPIIDLFLDWIPFYHAFKLFIAFSLTYKTDTTSSSMDLNPFPLVGLNSHEQQQFEQCLQNGDEPNLMYSYAEVKNVPKLPPTAKIAIDLVHALILLAKAYCKRGFRISMWRLRTWAYNIHTKYSSIIDESDLDQFALLPPTKPLRKSMLSSHREEYGNTDHVVNNASANSSSRIEDQELDEILSEYVLDGFEKTSSDVAQISSFGDNQSK